MSEAVPQTLKADTSIAFRWINDGIPVGEATSRFTAAGREEELRIGCLRLAIDHARDTGNDVVALARKFYDFVTSVDIAPSAGSSIEQFAQLMRLHQKGVDAEKRATEAMERLDGAIGATIS